MSSNLLFISSVILTTIVLMLIVFKFNFRKLFSYFRTKDGLGILKGIVIAVAVAVILAFADIVTAKEKGEWWSYGEIYFGVDNTDRISPQCYRDGVNNRITSNLGAKANIFRSSDRKYEFNIKYTHHSCAFNRDRYAYDAIGIEYTYRLWGN